MMRQLKSEDDRGRVGPAEKTATVISGLLTLGLFSFALYSGITAPDEPELSVRVTGIREAPDGVFVDVELVSRGHKGFVSVTLELGCDDPPPSVTLENVPAVGKEEATLRCPPGTEDPEAVIVSQVPA